MDLTNREKALAYFRHREAQIPMPGARAMYQEAIKALEQPTVDPERKKGKWNFIGDNMFECTSCGVVYTTSQLNGLRNYDTDPYAPKFCPNCGADMRGEQND